MTKEKKEGAAAVGLYLKIGPDLAMDVLFRDLKQIFFVINSASYERNMHALEVRVDKDDPEHMEKAQALCAFASMNGVVPVYRGAPDFAREIGAEAVLLETLDDMESARGIFGEEGIVGFACGLSNDDAAAAYDAGVDFVSFGVTGGAKMPSADILKFWTMLTDKPAVIEGPVTNDYCAYYVEAGAGFIDAADYIFSHGKGVMQGTVNMLHAIDLALEGKDDTPQEQQ